MCIFSSWLSFFSYVFLPYANVFHPLVLLPVTRFFALYTPCSETPFLCVLEYACVFPHRSEFLPYATPLSRVFFTPGAALQDRSCDRLAGLFDLHLFRYVSTCTRLLPSEQSTKTLSYSTQFLLLLFNCCLIVFNFISIQLCECQIFSTLYEEKNVAKKKPNVN